MAKVPKVLRTLFLINLFYIHNCVAITGEKRFPTNRNGDQFTNMVVKDDQIYLAENGWIHILDSNLTHEKSFRTCVSDECENINKVLALSNDMIVTCGTGNSGICQAWKNGDLYSFSSSDLSVQNYLVVPRNINRPAMGLVYNGDLFLGVTYGDGLGTTRNGLETYNYLLSRTNLQEYFSLLSYITLQNHKNEDYLVYFRKVFKAGSFIYFLTNQKLNLESSRYRADYKSKLIRICINEINPLEKIRSYTDIVLNCEVEGVEYNLLQDAEFLHSTGNLVAVFSKGDDPENPTAESAICVYTIGALDDAILRATEDFVTCSTSNSTRDTLAYLDIHHKCLPVQQYQELEADFICPTYSAGRGNAVIGNIFLEPNSTKKIADTFGMITTVGGTDRYGIYPDVYLGNDKGSISKISIDDGMNIFWYEYNVTIDKGHPIKDVHITDDMAYILTDRKVFKVTSNSCSQYTTCNETMEGKNPSCGWCILESRSTKKSDCPNHWLSSLSECIKIDVSPRYIAASTDITPMVFFVNENLPSDLRSSIRCIFRSESSFIGPTSTAVDYGTYFKCSFPGFDIGKEVMTLQIIHDHTRKVIAEATFQIYNCNSFKTCGTCLASSEINCKWCIGSLTCNETCDGSYVRQGQKDSCPMLLNHTGIYLPNGISNNIKLPAANLVPYIHYKCALNKSTGVVKTDAVADIYQDVLYCFIRVSVEDSAAKSELPLVVYQVKDEIETEILSQDQQFVTVYKCELLATDCTMCNALKTDRYDCHWCVEGHCGHKSTCVANDTCPLPTITKVEPNKGGYKGATTITITGANFGTSLIAIHDVTVGYLRCRDVVMISLDNDDVGFVISGIRCTLFDIYDLSLVDITLNVTFMFESVKVGTGQFTFKEPVVTLVEPDFGPISGGTRITLHGTDLMTGNRISYIKLGYALLLSVEYVDANSIICTTPRIWTPVNVTTVRIRYGGSRPYDSNAMFRFLPAPMIETISSYRFISSGGTSLTIHGRNLENAYKTSIRTFYAGETTTGKCDNISSLEIACTSPSAPSNLLAELQENLNASEGDQTAERGHIFAELSVHLDGYVKRFKIKYLRDPELNVFHEWDSVRKIDTGEEILYITGQYMNLAANFDDYKVSVGPSGICHNFALKENNLSCTLLLSQVDSGQLFVKVSVGFFNKSLGYIRYNSQKNDKSTTNEDILKIGVSVAAVLIVLIITGIIVFCVMYRRAKQRVPRIKSSKKKKSIVDHITGVAARFKNKSSSSSTTNIELNQQQTDKGVYEGLDLNQPNGLHLYSDLAQK